MIQSFHEACYEAIQRRFIESPVLYERLPLPIPEEKNNMLHVSKEALEYVIEAGFTSITYNLPQIFYNDIVAIAGAKGNSLLERYLLDLIISNACIAHEGVYPLCRIPEPHQFIRGVEQVFQFRMKNRIIHCAHML